MATRRSRLDILMGTLTVAIAVVTASCSSGEPNVVTDTGGNEPSEEAEAVVEGSLDSFLAGTVWIVEDLDNITPYGAPPAMSFTTEAGLVLTVTDACGTLRQGLTAAESSTYDLDRVEDFEAELCDDMFGRFFAEAVRLTIERTDALLVVQSGDSVLRASHVVSDSAHPDDLSQASDIPWCVDVERPQPRIQGDLPGNRNPDDIPMGVLHTYAEEHPDTFAYINIDRDNGGVVVVAFTDDPGQHYEALLVRAPTVDDAVGVEPAPPIEDPRPLGEQDFPFDVVQVDYTQARLSAVQQSLDLGNEDGLVGSGSGNSLNRVTLSFVDPPTDRWNDIVASLPEEACVGSVQYTPDIPVDAMLLGDDGAYIGPAELVAVELYIDRPAEDTTTLTVLGTETACNSGQPMGDRMRGPAIVETTDRIVIAVGVVPNLAGGTCPSNPVEPFVFELETPLGERVVWNGIADEPIEVLQR